MTGLRGRALVLIVLIAGGSQGGVARANDVQVNTYTSGDQLNASVAMDADGDFIVVWASDGSSGTDSDDFSIQGQRYGSNGAAVGGEFQVNSYTTARQLHPSVAMDADGDFVVVWSSQGSSGTDASSWSVQGQRYASDGVAVGGELQVNTYTSGSQWLASVAMDADGDFVVAWQDGDIGTSDWSVLGQRFAADGLPAGGEFLINTYLTGRQASPSVASAAGGDFIVVWDSNGSSGTDSDGFSIQGQRYGSNGAAVGGEFQVNTYINGDQWAPSVALAAAGDFVVVWGSSTYIMGYGYYRTQIYGQRYASDGSAAGGEFRSDSSIFDNSARPSVAVDAAGDFVVAWHVNPYYHPSQSDIRGRRYAADGSPVGGELLINADVASTQFSPSVAIGGPDDFVAVWQSGGSRGTDTDGRSIQRAPAPWLFADGFESGDTSLWSQTTTP